MSALAMGLLKKGCSVSGSDLVKNDETKKLEELGAVIFTSQIRQNIEFVISKFTNKMINFVVSSAIKSENEEFSYCREKKLSIKHRSEILAMLMRSYTALAVAGRLPPMQYKSALALQVSLNDVLLIIFFLCSTKILHFLTWSLSLQQN